MVARLLLAWKIHNLPLLEKLKSCSDETILILVNKAENQEILSTYITR